MSHHEDEELRQMIRDTLENRSQGVPMERPLLDKNFDADILEAIDYDKDANWFRVLTVVANGVLGLALLSMLAVLGALGYFAFRFFAWVASR